MTEELRSFATKVSEFSYVPIRRDTGGDIIIYLHYGASGPLLSKIGRSGITTGLE